MNIEIPYRFPGEAAQFLLHDQTMTVERETCDGTVFKIADTGAMVFVSRYEFAAMLVDGRITVFERNVA